MNHFLQFHELQQELQKKNITKQSIQISKIIKKIIKKKVPEDKSTRSRHPYQPRSIIRGQVFAAPLPASRCTLFLTIPIHSSSDKCTVMHEDMGWGSLKRPSFPPFQFFLLCSQTSWLQMFVTHPNNFYIFHLFICKYLRFFQLL